MPAVTAIAAAAVVGSFLLHVFGTVKFVDNACANIESVLPREVIGQELALGQLTDVICHHLAQKNPKKPLVISVHGPPGVGKTYTHWWLARSLYNKHPSADLECPGMHCRGYKVVYGLDYLITEAAARLNSLKHEVVSHLSSSPEALLVVEEYDKLDCAARGLWRQLLAHPERANITSKRAVILMESNLGMTELEELLTQMGDRSKVKLAAAEELLRGVVFAQWRASQCEAYEDTLKFMSMIDVFMPYFPLERQHMTQLIDLALRDRAELLRERRDGQKITLTWNPQVTHFLVGKVWLVYSSWVPDVNSSSDCTL
eukprot:GHUV01029127.1.p1 GENE.GHUV01029127.1~~GHUV01029127.1.p1  ORF type:complete len:315 (+),score=79.44 GHUV01029127.1:352-1296(+)